MVTQFQMPPPPNLNHIKNQKTTKYQSFLLQEQSRYTKEEKKIYTFL